MPNGVSEALPPLQGLASQISWASQLRSQAGISFDRLATTIAAGANRYKALEPDEVASLLALVDEKRAKVLSITDAHHFLDHWQDPSDRVQKLIHADECWKSIVQARSARTPRTEAVVPVRYMGFDDAAGTRIFKFGKLPSTDSGIVFTVKVPVDLFRKHGISFQDGPAMCSAIMAAREAEDHLLTDEDCLAFVALRPSRAIRKPPRRKSTGPGEESQFQE